MEHYPLREGLSIMATCGIADVGSNTMRLSIFQYDEAGFRLLLNKKEMAGLAGYVKEGVLSPEGIRVACRVLLSFRILLENLGISEFHAFATASLRNISNTEEAVDVIRSETGVALEVISGAEEAVLSFRGALSASRQPEHTGLLADIGGGSTELVAYENGAIRSGRSLPMGSLSLYTQFVSGLFPTPEEAKRIRQQVRQELSRAGCDDCTSFPHLLGVGGTIRAVGKLCDNLNGGAPGRLLSAEEIRELYHLLKKGDKSTLRQILRSAPDRVHTFLPGLIILNTVIKIHGVETVSVSAQGVREGYLLCRVMGKGGRDVQAG